jgi:hypothetical protein
LGRRTGKEKRVKRIGVVAAAIALAVATAAAYGHTVQSYGTTFTGSDLCVFGSAHVQHGSAVIDSGADVHSIENWPTLGCSGEKFQNTYSIALRRQLYRWEANANAWTVCNDSGWVYNTVRAAHVWHQRTFQSAICGVRYYGTMGTGYVYRNIGGWSGGGVWSDYHWLPA